VDTYNYYITLRSHASSNPGYYDVNIDRVVDVYRRHSCNISHSTAYHRMHSEGTLYCYLPAIPSHPGFPSFSLTDSAHDNCDFIKSGCFLKRQSPLCPRHNPYTRLGTAVLGTVWEWRFSVSLLCTRDQDGYSQDNCYRWMIHFKPFTVRYGFTRRHHCSIAVPYKQHYHVACRTTSH